MQSFNELLWYVDALPPWLSHLIVSLVVLYTLCVWGLVLARTGRSPLWALLLLLPYVAIAGLWVLAYRSWPKIDRR